MRKPKRKTVAQKVKFKAVQYATGHAALANIQKLLLDFSRKRYREGGGRAHAHTERGVALLGIPLTQHPSGSANER